MEDEGDDEDEDCEEGSDGEDVSVCCCWFPRREGRRERGGCVGWGSHCGN